MGISFVTPIQGFEILGKLVPGALPQAGLCKAFGLKELLNPNSNPHIQAD